MKLKQLIILSIIFGILALGIFLKFWVRSTGGPARKAQGGSVALAEFDPAKLERIVIGRGNQAPGVELAKENGVWKVKSLWNAKADPAKVENLIEKIFSARGELRGSGKKLFPDFGIQDEDAFSVKFFSTGDISPQDFRIGTKQAGENAFFIRKDAGENVYLVEVNMAELLGIYGVSAETIPASLFWADLGIFNLDPERVTEITVTRLKGEEENMSMGLERKTDPKDPLKSSWEFLREGMSSSPDPDKVLKFMVVMNSLRAQKVVDPDGKTYGLEKPVWQLAVTEGDPPGKQDEARPSSQGGKKTLLNVGPKDDKGGFFYAKLSKDSTVFAIPISSFNDLNVDDTYFLKNVPPVEKPKRDLSGNINAGLPAGQEPIA